MPDYYEEAPAEEDYYSSGRRLRRYRPRRYVNFWQRFMKLGGYEIDIADGIIAEDLEQFKSQKFLRAFNKALKSGDKMVHSIYDELIRLTNGFPDLAPQTFSLFEQAIEINKDNIILTEYARNTLFSIIRNNPDLAPQALKLLPKTLQLDKIPFYDLQSAIISLEETIDIYPATRAQLSSVSMIDFSIKSFDDFKQYISDNDPQSLEFLDDMNISRNDLKSNAFKGMINSSANIHNPEKLYRNLIYAHQFCTTRNEKIFWAQQAAKLQDGHYLKNLYNDSTGLEKAILFINHPIFSNENIQRFDALHALAVTSTVPEYAFPSFKQIMRPSLFNAYIEHKSQIDAMPRKDIFLSIIDERCISKEANFFDAFTEKLRAIAAEPQFAGDRYYENLSDSLKKDEKGFRARAEELFTQMLKEHDKYATTGPNQNNNYYISKIFPDMFERYAELYPISEDDIQYAISRAYKAKKIAKLIYNDPEIKEGNYDSRLLKDIIVANPDNIDQVRRTIQLFYTLNDRPYTYGSSCNNYYPKFILPIAKREDIEEWMMPIIINACVRMVINKDRLGSAKDLFDACKTWKLNPTISKKEAVRIGKMPLQWRMVAVGIYNKIQKAVQNEIYGLKPLTKEQRELYWQEFAIAQKMGIKEAIKTYADNRQSNRKRLLGLMYGNRFSNDEMSMLINETSVSTIDELKVSAFQRATNVLLDLEWKRCGYGNRISDFYRQNIDKIDEINQSDDYSKSLYVKDDKGNSINFLEFYNSNRDWLLPGAFALAQTFGKTFPDYIRKVQQPESSTQWVHDAVYWLPKKLKAKDAESLGQFINKNIVYIDTQGKKHLRNTQDMEIIAKNWESLTEEQRNMKFNAVLDECRAKIYTNQIFPNFASEAASHGVSEYKYKKYEDIYRVGLKTPVPVDTNVVFLNGDGSDGLRGRFLPRKDPRVGFFGNYTGCCQHFDGVGERCAISSMKDPFSQLFVIENSKGEIIAGSWFWTTKQKYKTEDEEEATFKVACFDNVEARSSYSREEQDEAIRNIYKKAGQYLADNDYRQITIGKGNSDMQLGEFVSITPIPMNPMYTGYSDASSQVLLCENPNAKPINEKIADYYVTGACQEDETAMQMVANKCFPSSSRQLEMPEDPRAYLLRDKGRVVGYILWTENENSKTSDGSEVKNWIYDMAVLPEYRKGEKAASAFLLNEMMKHIKEVGGEWGAELRESTTLRYMKFMADTVKNGKIAGIPDDFTGRGIIDLEIISKSYDMEDEKGNKEPVYEAKFRYLSKEEQQQRWKQRQQRNILKRQQNILSQSR